MTQADLDLLHDFVADRISAEAFPRLESLLGASGDARRALRGLMAVEEGLEEMAAAHLSARYFGTQAGQPKVQVTPQATFLPKLGDAFAVMVGFLLSPAGLRRIGLPLAAIVVGIVLGAPGGAGGCGGRGRLGGSLGCALSARVGTRVDQSLVWAQKYIFEH